MLNKQEIMDFIVHNNIKQKFHLTKIGLFGSFARDEQSEQSDIDILVEIESVPDVYELKESLRTLFRMQFKRDVDIAREKYLKQYARKQILDEVIYVR